MSNTGQCPAHRKSKGRASRKRTLEDGNGTAGLVYWEGRDHLPPFLPQFGEFRFAVIGHNTLAAVMAEVAATITPMTDMNHG